MLAREFATPSAPLAAAATEEAAENVPEDRSDVLAAAGRGALAGSLEDFTENRSEDTAEGAAAGGG